MRSVNIRSRERERESQVDDPLCVSMSIDLLRHNSRFKSFIVVLFFFPSFAVAPKGNVTFVVEDDLLLGTSPGVTSLFLSRCRSRSRRPRGTNLLFSFPKQIEGTMSTDDHFHSVY